MRYLISPNKKQYKANLHCHSVLSDGKKTPEELKEMYKGEGYGILAITDHERPASHKELSDDDFLMLTGYECYIRPNVNGGKYCRYQKEIHLNLFAKEPDNLKLVCFDDRYVRYLKRDNALEGLDKVGEENNRDFSREFINKYIKTATENGYIVSYNHPYWSMDDEADILSYEGFSSLEICNYGSYRTNNLEYCGALYDKFLQKGRRIFCHAADDNHNADSENPDSFGAFTMIMPDEFNYGSVIDAMKKGEMYASMGPLFKEVSIDGDKIHIECSDVKSIFVYYGSKKPSFRHAKDGEALTSADFTIDSDARYVRVSIRDEKGNWADTRGFFPDEIK